MLCTYSYDKTISRKKAEDHYTYRLHAQGGGNTPRPLVSPLVSPLRRLLIDEAWPHLGVCDHAAILEEFVSRPPRTTPCAVVVDYEKATRHYAVKEDVELRPGALVPVGVKAEQRNALWKHCLDGRVGQRVLDLTADEVYLIGRVSG
eukprot:scaffold99560_cov102-Phaeocystis_antarctica.AAC.2